jgi:carboxymethylenebutenolidase
MNAISKYLTEEVVVDYAEGFIGRREALRQLSLLGVGVAVAGPMLAACDVERAGTPAPAPAPGSTSGSASTPAGPRALPTEAVTFAGPEGRTLQAAWAAAAGGPRGAVLVIHENRGLTDHIRSVAGRLAASGYSALALDLLSAEGGTAKFTDPAQATAALNAAPPGRFVADMKAGIGELIHRTPNAKPGAIGFCFGGGMVWSLLASGEPRLRAAAPFYGPLPAGADFAGSKNAAVLGVYAEQDTRVNASRDAAKAALEKAGLTHEIVTYPAANHAFFNDTGERYNPTAAAAAYQKVIEWFGRNLS